MILRLSTLALSASLIFSTLPGTTYADSPSDLPTDTPISQILSLASSALSSGSSQTALEYYDLAISRDPSNYLTLFKRGATYLSLGRSPQALSDFDKVLVLKPGFEGALLQRAKIRARTADFSGARTDYAAAGKGSGEEVRALAEAEGAVTLARDAEKSGNWEACVSQAGVAIMVAGAAMDLRQMRARCRFEKGEIFEAVGDLQHVLQMSAGAADTALQISATTFYSLGEVDKGIAAVRTCLHSDPDSKSCSRLFKREKKVEKELKKAKQLMEKRSYSAAVKLLIKSEEDPGLIQKITDDEKEFKEQKIIHTKAPQGLLTQVLEMACESYVEMNTHKRGTPYCTALSGLSPNALPALLHQAQTQIDSDEFEAAVRTLNGAREHHGQSNSKINSMLQNAQTLLKRSKTKDYYKVLDVPRDASTKEIKRAWLKATKLNHPDKAPTPAERPAYEKKMIAINEAYEVLGDAELKQRFDNGDDPNDPESQARGHGGPFQGSPFGGGGGGGGQQFFFRSGPGGGGGGGGGGMPNFGGQGGGFKFNF